MWEVNTKFICGYDTKYIIICGYYDNCYDDDAEDSSSLDCKKMVAYQGSVILDFSIWTGFWQATSMVILLLPF